MAGKDAKKAPAPKKAPSREAKAKEKAQEREQASSHSGIVIIILIVIVALGAAGVFWKPARDRLTVLIAGPVTPAPVKPAPVPITSTPTPAPVKPAVTIKDVAALQSRLKELETRLAVVEAQAARQPKAGAPETDAVLILALGDALQSGAPFKPLADLVRKQGAGLSDAGVISQLDALAAYGDKGVPTMSDLSAGFSSLALPEKSKKAGTEKTGMWDSVKARLRGLVSVRRVDGAGPDSAAAMGQKRSAAQAALNHGNPKPAMDLLGAGARDPEKAWVADARARIAADQLAVSLNSLLLRRLARPPQGR